MRQPPHVRSNLDSVRRQGSRSPDFAARSYRIDAAASLTVASVRERMTQAGTVGAEHAAGVMLLMQTGSSKQRVDTWPEARPKDQRHGRRR